MAVAAANVFNGLKRQTYGHWCLLATLHRSATLPYAIGAGADQAVLVHLGRDPFRRIAHSSNGKGVSGVQAVSRGVGYAERLP
jgi:hypothetical protein